MTERRPGIVAPREWNAAAYHVISEPQYTWGLRVLDRIRFAGDELVLDAGCGSGRLTTELRLRVPGGGVVGCDLSENMTHKAAEALGVPARASVVCADLQALPFREAFDLIFSTATLHWVRDHDRLFAELRRALRTGGRLEAQCGGGPNLAAIHARADALAAEQPFHSYFATWDEPWLFASAEETEFRLKANGFEKVTCWLEHAPTSFADADRFSAFLESVVMRPYLARLPDAPLRRRFLQTLVEQAAMDHPPFTLDYWRLNISAKTL